MGPGVAEEAGTPGNGVFLGERTTSPSPLAASSGCHVDKLYNPAGRRKDCPVGKGLQVTDATGHLAHKSMFRLHIQSN